LLRCVCACTHDVVSPCYLGRSIIAPRGSHQHRPGAHPPPLPGGERPRAGCVSSTPALRNKAALMMLLKQKVARGPAASKYGELSASVAAGSITPTRKHRSPRSLSCGLMTAVPVAGKTAASCEAAMLASPTPRVLLPKAAVQQLPPASLTPSQGIATAASPGARRFARAGESASALGHEARGVARGTDAQRSHQLQQQLSGRDLPPQPNLREARRHLCVQGVSPPPFVQQLRGKCQRLQDQQQQQQPSLPLMLLLGRPATLGGTVTTAASTRPPSVSDSGSLPSQEPTCTTTTARSSPCRKLPHWATWSTAFTPSAKLACPGGCAGAATLGLEADCRASTLAAPSPPPGAWSSRS
jgi:hypothetical protein